MLADLDHPTDDDTAEASKEVMAATGVSVTFGGVRALSAVTTTVTEGELVAVVGPNGAGKTTFLNAVSGLLRGAITGQVQLAGADTTRFRPAQICRLGVGRSFQDPRLIEDESALENVLCGAHAAMTTGVIDQVLRPHKAAREEAVVREQALEVMRTLDIEKIADRRVSDLSYGHRKLIDIGRAIVGDPFLLLLDEPTSGLDEHEQGAVASILLEIRTQKPKLTIVVVEHHMPLVRKIATRLIAFQAGTILMDGEPDLVMDSPAFKDALTGRTAGTPKDQDLEVR